MGNLCGSESKSPDPFSTPGRTLSSAPPQNSTSRPPKITGPPRRLGGNAPPGGGGDARSDAAAAAEARAKAAAKPTGKLGQQLNAQKMQRRTDTLQEVSREEVARREADQAAAVRSYN
ncbi:hypothetical protein O988_06369 [Pseudogymnoascus sp. VKM F-3808]|nr:hypothetical protein O988_06369 [Pseudogymnoascus sp. VKM F-3808]KFY48738.1 hypothetical protein V495_01076 [Pseudogymnoascus sp. VKM F-4514 (FW-929)]KFY64744.1 hypothetical protein V497_01600 [Pseudogymnoascus sp. VKM F-4516 (FW-969)]